MSENGLAFPIKVKEVCMVQAGFIIRSILAALLSFGICRETLAQYEDSLFVHLYTDSLKKGRFNYINIDGKLPDGRFIPLDSGQLEFRSSAGSFYGNSLYLPVEFTGEKVDITITLRRNKNVFRHLTLYIKKADESTPVPTEEEFYRNSRKKKRSQKKSGRFFCILQELGQSGIG